MNTWVREETLGGILWRRYYLGNRPHRLDGPAYEERSSNGVLRYCAWYFHGELHRTDGPAEEWFRENGALLCYAWSFRNRNHRLDGPAKEWFNESGKRTAAEYWLNGDVLPEAEHRRHAALLKLAAKSLGDGGVSL